MNKKEIKKLVAERLSQGTGKQAVFDELRGGALSDYRLAYQVAAYPNPERIRDNRWRIKILIVIGALQTALAFLIGWGIGAPSGNGLALPAACLTALLPAIIAFGFYRNSVGAYNAFILLSIIQLPRQFLELGETGFSGVLGIIVSIALVSYVLHLRYRLFPDFIAFTPQKKNRQYAFV